MSKVLFVLEIPEPKVRKQHAPTVKQHKTAKSYSRKQKHKGRHEEAPESSGAFLYIQFLLVHRQIRMQRVHELVNV